MSPKLYKAAEVCEIAQLQPYVLRSWEKEFPGIGMQKVGDGPRLYRQSDIDQVLRIKQLVFTEGLTLSGARRRIEERSPLVTPVSESEVADVAEVLDALASDARTRIARVRDGLKSILQALSSAPGTLVLVDDYALTSPSLGSGGPRPMAVATAPTRKSKSRSVATKRTPRVVSNKRGRASA